MIYLQYWLKNSSGETSKLENYLIHPSN